MDEYEMKDCIYRKEATEFINKCLKHEEKLQSVERVTLIAVKKYLESIPTADVRPVVRGKWKYRRFTESAFGFECTVCHTTWDTSANFCPNCGAMMEEATNV